MNDKQIVINLDVGKPKRPTDAKLTPAKRTEFLKLLANNYNITKAAAAIGVDPTAINHLRRRDPDFQHAYQTVLNMHLDNIEETSFLVAHDPTHKGYNDRKMLLEAHRRETYGRRLEVNSTNLHIHTAVEPAEIVGLFQRQAIGFADKTAAKPIPVEVIDDAGSK